MLDWQQGWGPEETTRPQIKLEKEESSRRRVRVRERDEAEVTLFLRKVKFEGNSPVFFSSAALLFWAPNPSLCPAEPFSLLSPPFPNT